MPECICTVLLLQLCSLVALVLCSVLPAVQAGHQLLILLTPRIIQLPAMLAALKDSDQDSLQRKDQSMISNCMHGSNTSSHGWCARGTASQCKQWCHHAKMTAYKCKQYCHHAIETAYQYKQWCHHAKYTAHHCVCNGVIMQTTSGDGCRQTAVMLLRIAATWELRTSASRGEMMCAMPQW